MADGVEQFIVHEDEGWAEVNPDILPEFKLPNYSSKTSVAHLVTRGVRLHMGLGVRGELIDTGYVQSVSYVDEHDMDMTDLTMKEGDDFSDVVDWHLTKEHYEHLIELLNKHFALEEEGGRWEDIIKPLAEVATKNGLNVTEDEPEDPNDVDDEGED